MASKNLILTVRPAMGGLDNTSDPTILDPNYLVTADNITYLEGGQRKKRPGFLQYSATTSTAGTLANAVAVSTAAARCRALIDTWDYSLGIPPVQRYVMLVRESIWRSTGNGLWTVLNAGSSFGGPQAPANIMLGQNHAVFSDSSTDCGPPVAYNLAATTLVFPTTGANWPKFQAAVFHQQRMVMLGLQLTSAGAPFALTPSDIAMTAAGNIFDSTGVDTVRLPIDPGDGDQVIGASQTFFRNLYVFKGPQYGSIHEISGNTTTSYTKNKIVSGAPVVSHKSIITTPTDIFWLSKYGAHSLQTTLKYGDVEQAFLSMPIQNFWRKRLINLNDLSHAEGFCDPNRNIIGWLVTPAGFTSGAIGSRSWLLIYNYALSDPAPGGKKFWSLWKISRQTGANFGAGAAALMLTSTGGSQGTNHVGEPHLFLGGDNGLIYQDYDSFDDDTAAYAASITTPIITRFQTPAGSVPETQEKQFTGITTFYDTNDSAQTGSITYTAQVDNRDAGTGTFAGGLTGGILGSFILGTGILGGHSFWYEESIIEGRGRTIQVTWSNAQAGEDFEHLGYAIRFAPAEGEAKEAV